MADKKLTVREMKRLVRERGLTLQQITSRDDGGFFLIYPSPDGKRLLIMMISKTDTEIDYASIESADLFAWMQAREDW